LGSHKRIKHAIAGRMTFEYTSFDVTGQAGMKLVVYTPLDSDCTVEKLGALLDGSANSKQRRRS
jgi:MmyB-like transcription regulator ligand binding domain